MGPLCSGLAADRLAGLVNSQRACRCGAGIWEGLAQSRPLLPGGARGELHRAPCREVRVVGFFKLFNILFFFFFFKAKKPPSPSHPGLTCVTGDWIVIRQWMNVRQI